MKAVFNVIGDRDEHNLGKKFIVLVPMLDMTRIHKKYHFGPRAVYVRRKAATHISAMCRCNHCFMCMRVLTHGCAGVVEIREKLYIGFSLLV